MGYAECRLQMTTGKGQRSQKDVLLCFIGTVREVRKVNDPLIHDEVTSGMFPLMWFLPDLAEYTFNRCLTFIPAYVEARKPQRMRN